MVVECGARRVDTHSLGQLPRGPLLAKQHALVMQILGGHRHSQKHALVQGGGGEGQRLGVVVEVPATADKSHGNPTSAGRRQAQEGEKSVCQASAKLI